MALAFTGFTGVLQGRQELMCFKATLAAAAKIAPGSCRT